MKRNAFPRERRHTLYFLEEAARIAPVLLDTEVDMTRVREHRAAAAAADHRYSSVSYVLYAAGRVLARHPEANAALAGRARPRLARYEDVNGKVTFDKTMNGQRVVVATIVPHLDRASLGDIQDRISRLRDGDADTMPELAPLRALDRMPPWLARLLYRRSTRPLPTRPARVGTFAVTSLGHRAVDGFHSVGGTTVTLGVGRILDRPVVRDGLVTKAPVMRLNLAFDHRVIDGAEAADVLTDIKEALESFPAHPEAAHDTTLKTTASTAAAPTGHS
jgi:pyruvate/2-oxoglutarate dehydrogenase complex dihydrolipoamide acyltransferase (E2) component